MSEIDELEADDPWMDVWHDFYGLHMLWTEPMLHPGNWLNHVVVAHSPWGKRHLVPLDEIFWEPALESGHYEP